MCSIVTKTPRAEPLVLSREYWAVEASMWRLSLKPTVAQSQPFPSSVWQVPVDTWEYVEKWLHLFSLEEETFVQTWSFSHLALHSGVLVMCGAVFLRESEVNRFYIFIKKHPVSVDSPSTEIRLYWYCVRCWPHKGWIFPNVGTTQLRKSYTRPRT